MDINLSKHEFLDGKGLCLDKKAYNILEEISEYPNDYLSSTTKSIVIEDLEFSIKNKFSLKKLIFGIVILIILAIIGFIAWKIISCIKKIITRNLNDVVNISKVNEEIRP